jgi:hypothetical protein
MDFGSLLFAGLWDRRLGVLGATGSTLTFIEGWSYCLPCRFIC